MFKTNLKFAWRNLIKDRQFTLLNLIGLSTGLASSVMIWLWINDELNMEKYNTKDKQLYQVMQNITQEGQIETTPNTAGLLAAAMATELPEVVHAATVVPASWFSSKGMISYGENQLKTGAQFVSRDYFNLFNCQFLEGDKNSLISNKNSIAISDELAAKLFNTPHVLGKTIKWNQDQFGGDYLITGVFTRNPANASERFDLLFNFDLFKEKRPGMEEWGNSDPRTYVLLKEGTDIKQFNAKIKSFLAARLKNSGSTLFVRKFSDQYLYAPYKDGQQSGGRIEYVKLFTVIAIFILVIACINFMNLSTAKASGRIKEVGIKKVVGAGRGTLILQYLGESVFMSFLSLALAIILILTFLPAFNGITGKGLHLDFSPSLILTLMSITLVTGLIAGSYPALYISGFKPAMVLKGKLKTSVGELVVRKGLVVFQFTLSVIAIIGVLTIYRQVNFIQSKNLGYNRDNVIDFPIPLAMDSASLSNAIAFVNEVRNIPGIVSAGSHSHNLIGDHGGISGFEWPGKDPSKDISFANLEMGNGFLQTVGIKIKEGRNFSENNSAEHEIIFNESAIRSMGLKDPIGKTIKFWGMEKQIVGVTADFNFESLYETVKPAFFQMFPIGPSIVARIKQGSEKQSLAQLNNLYATFYKGLQFDYKFLDEEYQALYSSENKVAVLSKYFAGLAILISCLGLFGLAAFTAQKRQKEIGIRKIVGASVSSVVIMLSKDFIKLVSIAVLIAFPIVWWAMQNWLNGFAYHIPMSADLFIISAIAIILITQLTISFQSLKAAITNPIKYLRTE